MNFKLKQKLSALTIFVGVAALIGCGSTSSKTVEQPKVKPEATVENKPIQTVAKGSRDVETKTVPAISEAKSGDPDVKIYDNSTKSTASSADKIGVPECDEYIAKYEACIIGKVPEAARAAMQSSIEQIRQSWKQAAANP